MHVPQLRLLAKGLFASESFLHFRTSGRCLGLIAGKMPARPTGATPAPRLLETEGDDGIDF